MHGRARGKNQQDRRVGRLFGEDGTAPLLRQQWWAPASILMHPIDCRGKEEGVILLETRHCTHLDVGSSRLLLVHASRCGTTASMSVLVGRLI